jgi:cytochrome c oxidase cbb3-type subunit 3
MKELRASRAANSGKLAKAGLEEIESNPRLLNFARAMAAPIFGDNCASCHGTAATGSVGYPNLTDDDWLWGGKMDEIMHTISVGIRDMSNDETRTNDMPAHKDMLEPSQIRDVAGYVLSLTGKKLAGANVEAGMEQFSEAGCTACHGEDAKGLKEMGGPNLTDEIWLYGGDQKAVIESIANGRKGLMPAWAGRLDPVLLKALAVYVHTMGGGEE